MPQAYSMYLHEFLRELQFSRVARRIYFKTSALAFIPLRTSYPHMFIQ